MIAGGISGGCLEQYVARHGRELVQTNASAVISFQADPDETEARRPVLGCGGCVEVLVERLTASHLTFLHTLSRAAEGDAPATAACTIDASSPGMLVERFWFGDGVARELEPEVSELRTRVLSEGHSGQADLGLNRRTLVHYVPPLTRLVILGAGEDVRPLCAIGRSLGWHVTVGDRRARIARPDRFPEVDRVLSGEWEQIIGEAHFTPQTAVVLMTHSLADDIAIVPLLAVKPFAYLGVLGPEQRRRWMLEGVRRGGARG